MQVDPQFELSSAELRKVDRIRFGILSPDEIKAMSVCEIQTPFTYDNAIPKDGGLLDLRMGTMERNIRCKSCNGDMKSCPGHFGHIELVKPCLHIGLMPIIAKILKCVCFYCSSLLLAPDNPKYHHTMRIKKPAKRLHAMLKICQAMKKCNGGFDVDASAIAEDNERERNGMNDGEVRKPKSSGCGNILPRYKVESGYEVLIEFPEDADAMLEGSVDRKKPLSATRIHEIFKRISDDDVRALGFDPQFARPDWFVLTVLAVPPPPVRPSVMFASSARSSDDLTYKLADIVKANQALKTQELQGAAEHILLDYTRLLQWHVATLMDNEISGQPQSFQRSGKPIKSIRQRIVGKGGRVRGNLMGKRVDFSARSVITPDPNLGIDQLGVPRTIAMNMTYPEIVTRFNIARMRQLVLNGPNIHPGAKTIIRDDGRQIDLRYIKKNSDLHLEIGYKVERHIVDGDPIIFNRQPSLHKMSMMGHKVRVFPWSTFRLNLSCTTPYNADFDGDEMNMHVPQTYGTRAEVLNIILSPRQVVSPQANKPVMGIVQDTLLGVMKFTFRDTFITRDLTFNILMCLDSWDGRLPVPAILKPQPMWTGKQLFSCLLPKINMAHTCFPADDHRVLTNHGFLFLDQVKARQANGDKVTFACYDKATQALVYRPALKLNEKAYEGELLDFTPDNERRAWGADSAPHGEAETDSNHLSLRVTPNHKMFVQFGETATSGAVQWYGKSASEQFDYVKQRADQLVATNAKPLPAALPMPARAKASAKPDILRMLAVATAGVGEVDGHGARAELSASLGLTSDEQVAAFLQLYGFWLGAGSLDQRGFIRFDQLNSEDSGFLRSTLQAVLAPEQWRVCEGAASTTIDVTDPRWFAFFNSEHDHSSKCFAPFVRLCTRDQLRLIVCGLHRDGAWAPRSKAGADGAKVIYTSSVRLRDELLDLLLRAGFSTYFTAQLNKRDGWAVHWCEAGAAAAVQLNNLHLPRAQIATEKFRGTVWCPEVDHPDHLIVVQRAHRASPGAPVTQASKPVIAGNSNNHPDNEEGSMSVTDTLVLVEMGELIQGTIDKKTVGNAQGSLIHLIWVEFGPFRCAQFFTEVQKMVNHWLINNGFSIGIGDAVATSSVLAEIENTITVAKTEVSNIINRARAGKLERTPGRTVNETFEGEVNGVLNKATDACGKLVKKALLHTNNVNAMVSAGSKGNAINICQIIACVAGDTLVTRPNGTAVRIDAMPVGGGAPVLGFMTAGSNLVSDRQEIRLDRGNREAFRITLSDGREIVATADHLFRTADGAWTRVDGLLGSSIVMGVDGTEDVRGADEEGYTLSAATLNFSMASSRDSLLAFARVLGAVLGDGSMWNSDERAYVAFATGAVVDRDSFRADVGVCCGTVPNWRQNEHGTFHVPLPQRLANAFHALPGVVVGKRLLQAASLPAFVTAADCPRAVKREFLAGLFGADGCAPYLHINGKTQDAFREVTLSLHIHRDHQASLMAMMGSIGGLCTDVGVPGGTVTGPWKSERHQDGTEHFNTNPEAVEVRLVLPLGTGFARHIGFRFALKKSVRLAVANAYWRLQGAVSQGWRAGVKKSVLNAPAFLEAVGAEEWFKPGWDLLKYAGTAPTFHLKVLAVKSVGQIAVFDINVEGHHAFLAHGAVVHNCVGQQNVSGKRIPFGFRNRSLPHFNKYDLGPESKGFVENSYLKGLTPQEFFFHAMGGREGLVDTAVKTAETGYIQRRLVKCMEDVMVQYDSSVRNALGEIIQFVYGEDGMDGCFIEKQKLDSAKMDDDKLRSTYSIDLSNPDSLDSWLAPDIKETLLRDRDAHSKLAEEYDAIMGDRAMLRARVLKLGDDGVYLPVNLKRLIWNAQKRFRVEGSGSNNVRSALSPTYIIDNLRNMCDRLIVIRGGDELSKEAQINATLLFKTMLRSTFAAKRVIKDYNLSKDAFTWLLGEIEARFNQALAHPGEMIGSIAAQSIGEPATQMTLNTFHYAGVSSKNVTLGVPRLREIIDVAASCKTPSLTVYLKSASAFDADAAKTVLNKLEFTTLKSVTERTEIYYDPTPENSCVEEDRDFLQFYFEIPDDDFSMESASPWMLRIVLDRKKKESKELTNADIANHINAEWKGDLKAIFSNDNASKLVLQIRFKNDEQGDKDANAAADDTNDDDVFLRKVEESLLNTMELRGIKGISKVFLRQEKVAKFSPQGKFSKEQEEWVLDTEGVALLRVMCVEEVDHTQCNSNVVTEMFDVLGIEAARASLLKELRAVIEFDGAYVNYRHLATLCDSMSFRGHLMSINRHGINRTDSGALMRCSFEETVEILVQAAAFSELDTMRGVSENIMLGNLAPLGTNSFKLFLNQPMLERYAIDEPDHAKLFSSMYAMDGMSDPNMPMQAATPMQNFGGSMSPNGSFSPSGGAFSPAQGAFSPGMAYSPSSPGAANFSPTSPSYSPTSPNAGYAGGGGGASYSPTSPSYSPTSPGANHGASYSPTSPSYSPTSPSFHNTSPSYSPTSPSYSPTSPGHAGGGASYSPTSPSYSPTSPQRGGGGGGASYSPTSPSYSPTSPGGGGGGGASYSPTSPSYSPTSPSRGGGGGGASYSPTSPSYSPTSPNAGGGGGADAGYSPTSPSYSPTSPAHNYSPTSPSYSPTSPSYSPDHAKEERKNR